MKKDLCFGTALCYVRGTINGVEIDEDDFGSHYDHDQENAEPYCCADMMFERISPTQMVLDKYHITDSEYEQICAELYAGLSFGCCGWCE